MRLPYAPQTPGASNTETLEIYNRIAARRIPRPLVPLDLTLLHAPPVADGYNSFIGSLRSKTILDPALLELSISRIAVLNNAVYEWNIHAPLALKAGLKAPALQNVRSLPLFCQATEANIHAWKKSCLTAREQAVLAYTDAMTESVNVSNEVFQQLINTELSNREIVELTATIAGYNCVSRILVALDVGENNAREMNSVAELITNLA
ncbi:Carboxymuconolactone decarboxylase [Penicillium manginii]|uniref:Carboxymuconolactone decarboxylase n=1 Tax=Penicillium manginii TaxID=203109 RepID=UPI002546926C|nr:Carboxymuconolactone decarboxylase [Penicillium manginii]KAJ5741448.1 Carboxymuconolactone decarboxylase [Penicillium manginii]